MPYTLSHAAAVLPLPRHASARLPLSALVAGSLSPDLLYFVLQHDAATRAHGPVQVITTSVPLGLGAWLLFHVLLKHPSIALFPPAHQTALRRVAARRVVSTISDAGWVALAVWLGALTHVAWDLVTHDPPKDSALAVLRTPLFVQGGHPVTLSRFLQYVSSVLGFVWIVRGYAAWIAPRAAAPAETPPLAERTRVRLLVGGAIASPLLGSPWIFAGHGFNTIELVIIGTTTIAFLLLCAFCLATRARR